MPDGPAPNPLTELNVVIGQLNLAGAMLANGDPKKDIKKLLDDAKTRLIEAIRHIGGDSGRDDNN